MSPESHLLNRRKPHPTEPVEVGGEPVKIDRLMVPIVRWFNQRPAVRTLHSCQGEPDPGRDGADRPYVHFRCSDPGALDFISRTLAARGRGYGSCEAHRASVYGLTFIVRFADQRRMRAWLRRVTRPGPVIPSCSDP